MSPAKDALRFEGRVIIVTGGGRGLGREHARLLAARGAQVVVNDLGGSPRGDGQSDDPASETVREITDAGGTAIADSHSVASEAGAEAIVGSALEAFGRVDGIINNAGTTRGESFEKLSAEALDAILSVHLRGSAFVTRAAWPAMRSQQYGRVLNVISNAGVFGLAGASAYSAAKGGLAGLTRALANEGAPLGISVNALAPAAHTRLTERTLEVAPWFKRFEPRLVSPVAAWLVHESCPVSGEFYSAGAGHVARIFVAESPGWGCDDLTLEDVRDHFDEIREERGYVLPKSSQDEMQFYRAALEKQAPGARR